MPDKDKLKEFISNSMLEKGGFLVDIHVSPQNRVQVFVDHINGFSIDDCVALSREITGEFDRDMEDYDLEVSSPGLSEPLKVPQQYEKNLGRQVEVVMKGGDKLKGKLLSVKDEVITLETKERKKLENQKRKKVITETREIELSDIKSTKVVVTFK